MRKKNLLFVLISIIAIIIIFITVFGVAIDIPGTICLVTKYYQTPTEAFISRCELQIDSVEQLLFISIDEYNGICLFVKDNDTLVVAQMKVKNNAYYYLGNLIEYELNGSSIDIVSNEKSISFLELGNKLSSDCFYSGHVYCSIISSVDFNRISDKDKQTMFLLLPHPFDDYYFLYYFDS